MKIPRKAAAVLGAAAVAASPLNAIAAAPAFPTQGDAIYTEGHGMCTLGYNDHAKGVSYVAAHCGSEGARVSMFNPVTEEFGEEIGTFHPSKAYASTHLANDWGTITWDPGVTMGKNVYSTDKIVPLSQIKRGDTVCHHGQTTHQGTNDKSCGTYYDNVGNTLVVQMESGVPGDSGGPVWVEGKGFAGVASAGASAFNPIGGKPVGKKLFFGAVPEDGRNYSMEELARVVGKAGGTIVDPPYTSTNDNSSTSSSDSSDRSDSTSSSSEMSDLQIAMIVISVLVTVLPMIAQLAQSFL